MKRHTRRHGFTLVEMLVVIGIIVVLVGLLIPAAAIAVSSARNTTMAIEIAELEKAIEKYKQEKGDYPPSMGELDPMTGNSLYLSNPFNSICERHLRKCYPKMTLDEKRNFYAQVAPRLSQSEALFFWLTQTQNDERNPFFGQAKNFKAYYPFAQERIIETEYLTWTDTNVTPNVPYEFKTFVYKPRYARETPFIYLDSRSYQLHAMIARAAPYTPPPFLESGEVQAYFDDGAVPTVMNPKTFQIICAGQDGEFGAPRDMLDNNGNLIAAEVKRFKSGINYTGEDKDNLTNFSGGKRLSDSMP